MANEYLKPQIPLKDLNSENYFYPLTTLDQIIIGNSRLSAYLQENDGKLKINNLENIVGEGLTSNRSLFFNTNQILTSSENIFINNDSLAINKTSITDGYKFEVNGVSGISDTIKHNHENDAAILQNYYNSTWYNLIRNHNNGNISISASSSGLYLGYENTTFINFLNNRARLQDGCLHLHPNNGNYREGIRIHTQGDWSDIILCGNDLTGDSGTSANTWGIFNNDGKFYITRNGSNSSSSAILSCVDNYWQINTYLGVNGKDTEYRLYINGNTLTNGAYAAYSGTYLISSVAGSIWPNLRIDSRAGTSGIGTGTTTYTTIAQTNWANMFYQIPGVRKTYATAGDASSAVTATYQYPAKWFFRQYSPNSNGTRTSYYEDYYLPDTTVARTNTVGYAIVTTKNPGALYWANVQCGASANTGTNPTVANIYATGSTWGGSVRTTGNWIGFYNALNGGTRYGYVQADANRMRFRKENGAQGSISYDFTGHIYNSAEYISGADNGFRIKSVILRVDGSNFYFLVGTTNTPGNNWNSLRPFYFNLSNGYSYHTRAYQAVWNDYAEFRQGDTIEPGRVVIEQKNGIMTMAQERLAPGAKIISDTYGQAMGETKKAKTPIAVSGRVLVYPFKDRNEYELGAAVCAAPGGTVDIMTREEIREYPERIIGTVSEIPTYTVWHAGGSVKDGPTEEIKVNGRIWVYVR